MSYDWNDIAYDQYIEELNAKYMYEGAIEHFTSERLQSAYVENPQIAKPIFRTLSEANQLFNLKKYTAAYIFAFIATEGTIRDILLKPIIYGVVHNISTADFVTEVLFKHTTFEKMKKWLSFIINEYAKIDLKAYQYPPTKNSLWQEINAIQKHRNKIIHYYHVATKDEARQSIGVASELVEKIFPTLINNLGLHLHKGSQICNNINCKI